MAAIYIPTINISGGSTPSPTAHGFSDNGMVTISSQAVVSSAWVYKIGTWTEAGGTTEITSLITASGAPLVTAVSKDGSTIVGRSFQGGGNYQAWKIVNGVYSTFGNSGTQPFCVSANGARIGGIHNGLPGFWEGGVHTNIPLVSGASNGQVTEMTRDGVYMVGIANVGGSPGTAFVWDAVNGTVALSAPAFKPRVSEGGNVVTFVINSGGGGSPRIWRRGIGVATPTFPAVGLGALGAGTDPLKSLFQSGTTGVLEFTLGTGLRSYALPSTASSLTYIDSSPFFNADLTKAVIYPPTITAEHPSEGLYVQDVPQASLNGGPFWTGLTNSEVAV